MYKILFLSVHILKHFLKPLLDVFLPLSPDRAEFFFFQNVKLALIFKLSILQEMTTAPSLTEILFNDKTCQSCSRLLETAATPLLSGIIWQSSVYHTVCGANGANTMKLGLSRGK